MFEKNIYAVKPNNANSFIARIKEAKENELKEAGITDPVVVAERPTSANGKYKVGNTIMGSSTKITKEFAFSTGYGGYFEGSTDMDQELHIFEFSLPVTISSTDDENIILSATYASGFRMVFKVSDIKSDLEVGFAGFAAQSELRLANIKVLFEIYGLGDNKLTKKIDLSKLFLFTTFDVSTYNEIIEVQKELVKFFQEADKPFDPVLTSIEIDPSIDLADEKAPSIFFALDKIVHKQKLKEALALVQAYEELDISEEIVKETYLKVFQKKDPDASVDEIMDKFPFPKYRKVAERMLEKL